MLTCKERDLLLSRQVAIIEEILKSLRRIEAKLDHLPAGRPRKVELPSLKPLITQQTIGVAAPTAGLSDENEAMAEEDVEFLCEALRCLGFTVDQVRPSFEQTEELNKLAAYIGEHWEIFRSLWMDFKRALQGRGGVAKKVGNYAPVDVSYICNLCTRMRDFAFLTSYTYRKAPHFFLQASISQMPPAQSFIGGEWFERFLLTEVKAALDAYCAPRNVTKKLRYINDTVVILPNQKGAEMDIFCEIDGLYFWLEAKTGDYQQHVEKYDCMAKSLHLPAKQVMVVILDLPETACRLLTQTYSHLTVLNQYLVRPTITQLFIDSFGEIERPAEVFDVSSDSETPSE